jgi:hypothetical protein
MRDTANRRDVRFQIWGWVLFILCALLFLASSLVNRDLLATAGSLVFLLACGVFLYPLITRHKDRGRTQQNIQSRREETR